MKTKISIWWFIVGAIIVFVLLKQCEPEPKTITKTEYVKVTDTITETIIEEIPKTVYVERVKTIKGKDSIIYRENPTDSTITANQYTTQLKSNNATADLEITTTGELLDVQGVINYEKEITTITEFKNNSGLFAYGQARINGFDSYAAGLDYHFKNKIIVGANVQYDLLHNYTSFNVKIGFRIK